MISENLPVPASSISGSQFRYRQEAPEFVTVPVSELLDRLPGEFRRDGDANGRSINLPCRDLLIGNTPRLSLGQLHDLLPDLVYVPEGAEREKRLVLSAGWLALYFCLLTKREEIPVEVTPGPDQSTSTVSEVIITDKSTSEMPESGVPTGAGEPSVESNQPPAEISAEELIPQVSSEIIKTQVAPPTKTDPLPVPKRSFFSSLLNFRRHQKDNTLSSPLEGNPEGLKLGKTVALHPPSAARGGEEGSGQKADLSTALNLSHLWKLDPQDQIADSSALQALFMTEEKLTLDRVIAMAGQLPGLRSCVLAHGNQVVCAPNTQPGVDLQSLSGQAMIMLTQIRESSAKMGIGSVPAVTLHADQGVLSFLHNGELCLLVLHADRGFVPGVRERLQEMLFHLSSAKALPGDSSAQPSLPI